MALLGCQIKFLLYSIFEHNDMHIPALILLCKQHRSDFEWKKTLLQGFSMTTDSLELDKLPVTEGDISNTSLNVSVSLTVLSSLILPSSDQLLCKALLLLYI